MRELEVEIKNNAGLHARPSALMVEIASKYDSEITLTTEGQEVNVKSIMGLMLLAAEKGRKILLKADGEDEEEAIKALQKLIEVDKFNEE